MSFIIPIMLTVSPIVCVSPTISFIISIVLPMPVTLTLILVKEMRGVWLLIPHASHLFLDYIPPVIVTGPVAWTGLLLLFALGVTTVFLVSVVMVHRPCHVNIKRKI